MRARGETFRNLSKIIRQNVREATKRGLIDEYEIQENAAGGNPTEFPGTDW
jgi:hypothetical protein